MRKFVLIIIFFATGGCRENIVEFSETEKTAAIFVASTPSGADIYLDEIKIGKITPDSLSSIQPGNYVVRLHLLGYEDRIVFLNILAGQKKYISVNFH